MEKSNESREKVQLIVATTFVLPPSHIVQRNTQMGALAIESADARLRQGSHQVSNVNLVSIRYHLDTNFSLK
jgi:hypothetical protein